MSPKLPAVEGGVSKLQHTDEEIRTALEEIQGLQPGQKRCKQAGLLRYLRNNPDATSAFAKGHDKDVILAKFHILQLRSANETKNHGTDYGFRTKTRSLTSCLGTAKSKVRQLSATTSGTTGAIQDCHQKDQIV